MIEAAKRSLPGAISNSLPFRIIVLGLLLLATFRPLKPESEKACEPINPAQPAGVYLRPFRPVDEGRFEFFEKFDTKNHERQDFIKGPAYQMPLLFYIHERSISPSVSHNGKLVLINDYFTTKGCRVIIAVPKTHRTWNISSDAEQVYKQNAKPNPRLVIIPQAYGFSPDDHRVLIAMNLVWTSAQSGQMARKLDANYKRWWFVVNSLSGKILHEYRDEMPPPCWWIY